MSAGVLGGASFMTMTMTPDRKNGTLWSFVSRTRLEACYRAGPIH
jgi:hypothetical protein